MSGTSPEPDFLLVDKLLVSALQSDIQPIIIINKTDLLDADSLQQMEAIYVGTGFPVIPMSKVTMQGYDDLHDKLEGSCTVFAGQSGLCKSTILNIIMDEWVMETNTVSEKIQGQAYHPPCTAVTAGLRGICCGYAGFQLFYPGGAQA